MKIPRILSFLAALALALPSYAQNAGGAVNTGPINAPAVVTGSLTANAIVVGAGGSTMQASGWTISGNVLTTPFSVTLTDNGSGGLTIAAAGTAQSIILTPSTSGSVLVTGTSALKFGATSAATIKVSADTTAGVMTLAAASAGSVEVDFISGGGVIFDRTNQQFRPAGAINVSLGGAADRWTGLFVKGTNVVSFGQTSAATIGVSADTTSGDLVFTPSSTGAFTFAGPTVNYNGSAGAADTSTEFVKTVTGIANATATTVATITIPNSANSGTVHFKLTGSLGTGGAIGANEATQSISYDVGVTRTGGVNAVAVISTAYGSSGSVQVAGATTITVTAALQAVSGAVGATNTIALQVTITRGGGSSTNHTCLVRATVDNANASGITLS